MDFGIGVEAEQGQAAGTKGLEMREVMRVCLVQVGQRRWVHWKGCWWLGEIREPQLLHGRGVLRPGCLGSKWRVFPGRGFDGVPARDGAEDGAVKGVSGVSSQKREASWAS